MDTFPADIRPVSARLASRDLVDLIKENDSVFLGALKGLGLDRVVIDEFFSLFVGKDSPRFGYGDTAFFRTFWPFLGDLQVSGPQHQVPRSFPL